jgi:hypothetical protein
MAFREFLT